MSGSLGSADHSKVISVRPDRRLANRMLQYMAALALSRRIAGSSVSGVELREWDVPFVANPDSASFGHHIVVSNANLLANGIEHLAAVANAESFVNIMLEASMQRMEFLDPPESYADVFPRAEVDDVGTGDLLINVHTEERLVGFRQYPILPSNYYHWLASVSGLDPVFCGQLGASDHVAQIRRDFPRARFIETRDAIEEFQLVRSARHIAPSVSTFSWLAAWLSKAETIFLPLCGFLSPVFMRGIDLLPTSDPRYRFIQFPMFFGTNEDAMLQHHRRLDALWKEISPRQVALLRDASPFLAPRSGDIPFDPLWYCHTYLDAAQEIADGWFEGPLHHYLEIGRKRGHLPTADARPPTAAVLPGRNLARLGLATQSSVSQWSREATVEADAAIGISGRIWEDKFFHTGDDEAPWWRVDLRAICSVTGIRIFNRDAPLPIQLRAAPLVVEGSVDGELWFELFRTAAGQHFGGRGGTPLLWAAAEPVKARFVRITIPRRALLHLAEVEVYGTGEPQL